MALSYRPDDVYVVATITIGKVKLINNENNVCSDQHDRVCLSVICLLVIIISGGDIRIKG